jgi:predicted Zn-dependent peptidase
MRRELEESSRTGLSSAAFQTAKRRLESSLAIQSQYSIRNAYFGARAAQLDIPHRTLSSLLSRVGSITLDEVNRSFAAMMRRSQTWVAPAGKP